MNSLIVCGKVFIATSLEAGKITDVGHAASVIAGK
jgi:hypothetical protein